MKELHATKKTLYFFVTICAAACGGMEIFMTYFKTTCASPVGQITLAGDGENLVGLWLEGQKYFGGNIADKMVENSGFAVFDKAKLWLNAYFRGENPAVCKLPLAPVGGEFRQTVWGLLLAIPYGETTTYGELARKLAALTGRDSMSAQAVGGAVGHNPISIIIPCHRVLGADGSLTGYAGGVEVKARLLKLERGGK